MVLLGLELRMFDVKLLHTQVVDFLLLLVFRLIGLLLFLGQVLPQHSRDGDQLFLAEGGVLAFNFVKAGVVKSEEGSEGCFWLVGMTFLFFLFLLSKLLLLVSLHFRFGLLLHLELLLHLLLFLLLCSLRVLRLLPLLFLFLSRLVYFVCFCCLVGKCGSGDLMDLFEGFEEHC